MQGDVVIQNQNDLMHTEHAHEELFAKRNQESKNQTFYKETQSHEKQHSYRWRQFVFLSLRLCNLGSHQDSLEKHKGELYLKIYLYEQEKQTHNREIQRNTTQSNQEIYEALSQMDFYFLVKEKECDL